MRHGSLFSGIGGFDLAAEWMGWTNVFHCEIEDFPRRVLNHYWPDAISYDDIKQTDFNVHRGQINILTGGFPCQPYSQAGKRKGKEDDRHLWPEMLRAIRQVKPTWVVGENVRGLINWSGGLVFDEVQADLEAAGYQVQPFLLPACGVGAPHRRDRIWFIAYAKSHSWRYVFRDEGQITQTLQKERLNESIPTSNPDSKPRSKNTERGREKFGQERSEIWSDITPTIESGDVAHPNINERPQRGLYAPEQETAKRYIGTFDSREIWQTWENFPTQPPIRERNDGISDRMVGYISNELYSEISKTSEENRIKNLPEVWEKIQQEEVWRAIRGLYSLDSKEILFQTMQLYQTENKPQINISPFSEKFSKKPLRELQKHREFRRSPQGRKLEEQRSREYSNIMSFLPHEVALAARRYTRAISEFDAWQRNESIKGYGNAIVPQVVYQIFKAIEEYETSEQ